VIGVLTAIVVPIYLRQVEKAREVALRIGVRGVQFAVLDYEIDNGSFPAPALVDEAGLGDRLDGWPANPWTGRPMVASNTYSRGDFDYAAWTLDAGSLASTGAGLAVPATGLDRYGLIGYTSDPRRPFVALPLVPSSFASGSTLPGAD
jgi:type II secretory pathway pseudopilin PulG